MLVLSTKSPGGLFFPVAITFDLRIKREVISRVACKVFYFYF